MQNDNKLHESLDKLIEKHKDNEYVYGRLVTYIEHLLPIALDNAVEIHKQREDRYNLLIDQIKINGRQIASDIASNPTNAIIPFLSLILYSIHLQIHQNYLLKDSLDQDYATCAVIFDESFLCLLSKIFSLG